MLHLEPSVKISVIFRYCYKYIPKTIVSFDFSTGLPLKMHPEFMTAAGKSSLSKFSQISYE